MDAESRRLIDWMEKGMPKTCLHYLPFLLLRISFILVLRISFILVYPFCLGVYDALQKKYLKTLLFCVCEAVDGPMIEEYACKSSRIYCFQRNSWFA